MRLTAMFVRPIDIETGEPLIAANYSWRFEGFINSHSTEDLTIYVVPAIKENGPDNVFLVEIPNVGNTEGMISP